MFNRTAIVLGVMFLSLMCSVQAAAQNGDDIRAEIEEIRKQLADMDALKDRLAELEKRLDESQKEQAALKKAQEEQSGAVTSVFKEVKARIDGRIFITTADSGNDGAYPNWTTDISDAKLRFTWNPSKRITVVNRLRSDGAEIDGFDYFYLDYAGIFDPTSLLRLGQRKIDVGQETWIDNPVENILITTSASNVAGYGTGIAFRGKLGGSDAFAPLYEVGYVNGPRGVMNRPTSSVPFNVKIGKLLANEVFVSASYFDSGKLRPTDASAIDVARISGAPTGATDWRRRLWELDIRYNFGETGTRSIIPSDNLPRTMLSAAYGAFHDDASDAEDRDGNYWYVEGLYNLSDRFYTAARYSTVDLKDDVLAELGRSPVPVNSYSRTSIGLGYRLSRLTNVKTEYTFNETDGGVTEPSLNQWAVGLASKF